MYTFSNIDLDHFLGSELREVSIVPYNISLRFDKGKEQMGINTAGKWAIHESNGAIFDQGDCEKHPKELKIHNLLTNIFSSYEVPSSRELRIRFSNGQVLALYDDEKYETCTITPNIIV